MAVNRSGVADELFARADRFWGCNWPNGVTRCESPLRELLAAAISDGLLREGRRRIRGIPLAAVEAEPGEPVANNQNHLPSRWYEEGPSKRP